MLKIRNKLSLQIFSEQKSVTSWSLVMGFRFDCISLIKGVMNLEYRLWKVMIKAIESSHPRCLRLCPFTDLSVVVSDDSLKGSRQS